MMTQGNLANKLAFDFIFDLPNGDPFPLAQYQGKTILIANTASQCGFVGQLQQLEEVYQKYKSDNFMVIAVPSDDFGQQEPLTNETLCPIYQQEYHLSFPIMAKTNVKGPNGHPFFKWAGQLAGFLGQPRWNFHKFLIAPDGSLDNWFSSMTKPTAPTITKKIELLRY